MKQYLYALTFYIVVDQLLSFIFQQMFLLSWWKLPQSQCYFISMKLCITRLMALIWGSFLDPILANIFVGFHERLLFEKFPKPFIYLRYVDDTFATLTSRIHAFSFFHKLNDLHPSLSFVMEEEKSNKLPFLDVLVERCEFSFLSYIYRKPTYTGLYLSWDSFAPRSKKPKLIKCLSFRALNICCESKIKEELKVIKEIFMNNGYPEEIIDENINLTVTRFKNKNKIFGPPKCPVYFRLPWIGPVSQSFAEKVASSVYRCYHTV